MEVALCGCFFLLVISVTRSVTRCEVCRDFSSDNSAILGDIPQTRNRPWMILFMFFCLSPCVAQSWRQQQHFLERTKSPRTKCPQARAKSPLGHNVRGFCHTIFRGGGHFVQRGLCPGFALDLSVPVTLPYKPGCSGGGNAGERFPHFPERVGTRFPLFYWNVKNM